MGKEFLNGLRLTSSSNNDIDFKIEGIGLANNPEVVINSIQKLVNQEDVQILTGIVGHNGFSEVLDFVEEIEENFIFSDFGANAPLDITERKGIWCNSFDLYQSANLLGKYFSDKGINNIGISTSYYDAGYGFVEAIEKATNENNSSKITGHFISPLHPRENEGDILSKFTTDSNLDAIFAFHNGVFAKEHASFLKENNLTKKTPFYSLPFSIDKKVLDDYPHVFNNTFCASSWMSSLKTKENEIFVKKYKEIYNTEPSIFALLGYENGILINNFFINNGSLVKNDFVGPRGTINVDSISNRTTNTHYLWKLKYEDGNYTSLLVQELNYKYSDNLYKDNKEQGGWHNAYLCH